MKSINCMLRIFFKRLFLFIKSIYVYLMLKIKYGSSVKISLINSIKGNLSIDLDTESNLEVGNFLMSAGPIYIKCCNKARCIIGNKVFFNHNCSITCQESISIGDNCNIANNVVIVDHDHKIGEFGVIEGFVNQPVIIGENVWIGANSTILKGSIIGDGAIIASGAVVKGNVPPYEVWGGVPAKKIRSLKNKQEEYKSK